MEMVAGGIGITLLPAIAARVETRANPDLVLLPFTHPRPHRTIGLAWRRTSVRGPEFEALGAVITEHGRP
jgi:LysR family hydrogen peroxide-inducible transcriptional activator